MPRRQNESVGQVADGQRVQIKHPSMLNQLLYRSSDDYPNNANGYDIYNKNTVTATTKDPMQLTPETDCSYSFMCDAFMLGYVAVRTRAPVQYSIIVNMCGI